jgi:hypothetical protein
VVSRLPPPTRRPVRTRFRFGTGAEHLNLADNGKSPDHCAKGTPSPWGCPHRALTACKRVVSGSLSSPGRGSSHLSLALLGSLSVAREYLALRDGPRRFRPTSTCSALLRCRTGGPTLAVYGTFTRYGHAFQRVRLREGLLTPMCPVLQPHPDESGWFGLVRFRSPLLTESLLLSSPPGNEMFQVPGFATRHLWIQCRSVRVSRSQSSFDSSTGLIAVFHALRRLLAPRHPPHALSS